ncbi:uncharacterized protein B0H18DRAFT_1022714 [Fomitopsis serialis]|uniref:uncharacterized protein n=1 Tax=Fomitopsis serialis TaxID=139415 RepID=UPI002007579A|nr:uncharacterized protein B0H18DRAFT_1022714 [Neoantrodia serialis]KAH9920925.1 hypothetical protein B0H18DRAFT_1022714 [Neoantrodia serialis]
MDDVEAKGRKRIRDLESEGPPDLHTANQSEEPKSKSLTLSEARCVKSIAKDSKLAKLSFLFLFPFFLNPFIVREGRALCRQVKLSTGGEPHSLAAGMAVDRQGPPHESELMALRSDRALEQSVDLDIGLDPSVGAGEPSATDSRIASHQVQDDRDTTTTGAPTAETMTDRECHQCHKRAAQRWALLRRYINLWYVVSGGRYPYMAH